MHKNANIELNWGVFNNYSFTDNLEDAKQLPQGLEPDTTETYFWKTTWKMKNVRGNDRHIVLLIIYLM